ncbi:MAG: TetR/AcrR family transcriptional regulator [Oscillospiraceae bacterium]|nr:TetR/AcrR family transcriptional regulator [Oscillospiraceae bacterium]
MLVEAAMEIVKEHGINSVTARTAAKAAECSIQPVFACFGTMDNFKEKIFEAALNSFMGKVGELADSADYFGKLCTAVLRLASEEPNVYRLLFCEQVCSGRTAAALRESFLKHRKYLDKMVTMYGLNEKSCIEIIGKGIVYLCGISGIVSSDSSYTGIQNGTAEVKMVFADLVTAAQRKRDNEKKRIVRKINDESDVSG